MHRIGIQMYQERLNYQGDLKPILQKACVAYNVGNLVKFSLIETGYEDFNIKVETVTGNYLVKIFAKSRTDSEIQRLVSVMLKVMDSGISAPRLHKAAQGFIFQYQKLSMVFMDFIDGKTFYELGITPPHQDLQEIIQEVAKTHQVKFDELSYLPDSWSVQNINNTYRQVKEFITDRSAVDFIKNAIDKWNQIPLDKLPTSFVHGDIIPTNVIKGNDGKIYIIDFSVANLHPRIQDLAVITGSLMAGNDRSLSENTEMIMDLYNNFIPLTDIEKKYLSSYAQAEVSTIYMGAIREKVLNNNNSSETNYLMDISYKGMIS